MGVTTVNRLFTRLLAVGYFALACPCEGFLFHLTTPNLASSRTATTLLDPFLVRPFGSQKLRRYKSLYEKGFGDQDEENTNDNKVEFDDFDFVIGETNEYNDFDFVVGETNQSPPEWQGLNARIQATQEQEVYRDAKLQEQWTQGDWTVRGFSLDPYDAEAERQDASYDGEQQLLSPSRKQQSRIYVCSVVADLNHDDRVWVGRTDGSVLWIQLGSDYSTQFRSKLTEREDESNTEQATSYLVREDAVQPEEQSPGSDISDKTSFSILAQFMTNSDGNPISTILSVLDEDCIFTSCGKSGEIQKWQMAEVETPQEGDKPFLATNVHLAQVHTEPIVALKAANFGDSLLLFSVSVEGTLALWDMSTVDLIYQCQICGDDPDGFDDSRIQCADVSGPSIFLGTGLGYVMTFDVSDMTESASTGNSCAVARTRFLAHQEGVTAVSCGGDGSLGRGDKNMCSTLLLTGGKNGDVKQWEILSSKTSGKTEAWPKLANQRLPKKAHLFKGHDSAVNALFAMKNRPQILSAGQDGTIRMWNAATGKEQYRMDGFSEDISSLCLQGEETLLVTDGMNHNVCVHDFDMQELSVEDFLDFDFD